jgi:hypothetical protein
MAPRRCASRERRDQKLDKALERRRSHCCGCLCPKILTLSARQSLLLALRSSTNVAHHASADDDAACVQQQRKPDTRSTVPSFVKPAFSRNDAFSTMTAVEDDELAKASVIAFAGRLAERWEQMLGGDLLGLHLIGSLAHAGFISLTRLPRCGSAPSSQS